MSLDTQVLLLVGSGTSGPNRPGAKTGSASWESFPGFRSRDLGTTQWLLCGEQRRQLSLSGS